MDRRDQDDRAGSLLGAGLGLLLSGPAACRLCAGGARGCSARAGLDAGVANAGSRGPVDRSGSSPAASAPTWSSSTHRHPMAPRRCHDHIRSRRASGASRYYRHIGQTQVGRVAAAGRVMDEPRYAIYFVPPARSDLYRFGARFLGYDCYSGDDLGHPADIGLAAIRLGRTYARAAPIRISRHTEGALSSAASVHRSGFGGGTRSIYRSAACVRIGRAHHPSDRTVHCHRSRGASPAVDQLAADCVTVFDRFRRPLTAAGTAPARWRGRERSPDRKPRPLGLPVRVRGLSLSHDADRRDRCQPPRPDHRACAGCLRAKSKKADRSRSPNSSWRARTRRQPGFALCGRRSWQRRRHVDSASPASDAHRHRTVETSPAPPVFHPAVISG